MTTSEVARHVRAELEPIAAGLQLREDRTRRDPIPEVEGEPLNGARIRRGYGVLHFHRLDGNERRAALDALSRRHVHRNHGAGERRHQRSCIRFEGGLECILGADRRSSDCELRWPWWRMPW